MLAVVNPDCTPRHCVHHKDDVEKEKKQSDSAEDSSFFDMTYILFAKSRSQEDDASSPDNGPCLVP